jgi:TonB family protein
VFLRAMRCCLAFGLMTVAATTILLSPTPVSAQQQEELTRKAKSKVQPMYPDLAKRMNITGTVKIQVVVAPNGTIKNTKVVGGHPVLATAAIDALKKWRFEPASDDTSGVVEFKFESPN